MLKQVLIEMVHKRAFSHAELARRLDISEGLLDQMLIDLARKDYVTQISSEECDLEKCPSCPLGGNCVQAQNTQASNLGQRWILTEKGRRAATEP